MTCQQAKDGGEMTEIISFEQALQLAPDYRHVLLGNGFSRACFDKIFAYDSLWKRADFEFHSEKLRDVFKALGTRDFELVMDALKRAAIILSHYSDNKFPKLTSKLIDDAENLKSILVKTISDNHPSFPGCISDDKYESCRCFLANFTNIYTFNYDLLLYWTLMHKDNTRYKVECDDGFRKEDKGESFVTWDVNNTNKQNVFYLHGALHLFDAGEELQKYTWHDTGIRLLTQVKDALDNSRYPLFVAEDTSKAKKNRIQHSGYLNRCFRSFSAIGNNLFIYGHSLAENDEHILTLIDKSSKIKRVFVSIYGAPDSQENKLIIRRAKRFVIGNEKHAKEVHFYDAASTAIWNNPSINIPGNEAN